MAASDEASLERLRADVAELLFCDPAEVSDHADLFAAGVDSLAVMQLIEKWQPGSEVSFTDLAQAPTLVAWHAMLAGPGVADGSSPTA